MKFTDLVFRAKENCTGDQAICKFKNGYGASVIIGGIAYGSGAAPYELAVIKYGDINDDDSWGLTYGTPITDDVIGHNTKSDIDALLVRIEAL